MILVTAREWKLSGQRVILCSPGFFDSIIASRRTSFNGSGYDCDLDL